jgi:hypothetical protein
VRVRCFGLPLVSDSPLCLLSPCPPRRDGQICRMRGEVARSEPVPPLAMLSRFPRTLFYSKTLPSTHFSWTFSVANSSCTCSSSLWLLEYSRNPTARLVLDYARSYHSAAKSGVNKGGHGENNRSPVLGKCNIAIYIAANLPDMDPRLTSNLATRRTMRVPSADEASHLPKTTG